MKENPRQYLYFSYEETPLEGQATYEGVVRAYTAARALEEAAAYLYEYGYKREETFYLKLVPMDLPVADEGAALIRYDLAPVGARIEPGGVHRLSPDNLGRFFD